MPFTRRQDVSIDDELVAPAEAAKFLGVAVNTIRFWRAQRRGPPYVRVGTKAVRYRRGDLLAFIEAGRCNPVRSDSPE